MSKFSQFSDRDLYPSMLSLMEETDRLLQLSRMAETLEQERRFREMSDAARGEMVERMGHDFRTSSHHEMFDALLSLFHDLTEYIAHARGKSEAWLDCLHESIGHHFLAANQVTDNPLKITRLKTTKKSEPRDECPAC